MFCSVSFSGHLSRSPWTLRRFDYIIVCSKKKPPNNGYPGRGKKPRKKYSEDTEDVVDISPLYEASDVIEIPTGFVVDCNKHINRCIKRHSLQEAQEVFDLMLEKGLDPDVVTYNTLMKGYSEAGNNQMVYKLFRDMEQNGVRPTEITFSTIIRACANIGDLQRALILFDKMKNRYWLKPNYYIYSAMFNVCASAKHLEKAKKIFEEMVSSGEKYNAITLTTFINVYAECCSKDNARQYLKECRELLDETDAKGVKSNLWTLNTLLKLCSRGSLTMEAMAILDQMKIKNMRPNAFSYSTVIDGISKDQKLSNEEVLEFSKGIVDRMKQDEIPLDVHTYNNRINVALRTEDLSEAVAMFNEIKKEGLKPNATTFGTMIKCHEKLGDPGMRNAYWKPCLNLLKECEQSRIILDLEGYTSLLSACANVANLEVASNVWSNMMEATMKPNVFAYSAMINVCLSANKIDKAFEFLGEMKTSGVEPNEVTYTTLITHFIKKKDRSEAKKILDEMKTLGMQPDKNTLRRLKALELD